MNLFYSAGPSDNGHPEPNSFNFIFSFVVGGMFGNRFYSYITKKNRQQ
jgi:hypothetical protein